MNSSVESSSKTLQAAVASYEGLLVNQHLGMAESLLIFKVDESGCRLIDRRRTPPRGEGARRWKAMADLISDCTVLLANSVGETPAGVLSEYGLTIYEVEGLIEDALVSIYEGKELHMPHRRRTGCKRAETGQQGDGCG